MDASSASFHSESRTDASKAPVAMVGARPNSRAQNPADRIAHHIDAGADGIAQRRGAKIGSYDIRTLGDAPDEQGLAEIAALPLQARLARNIEKAAHAYGRIGDETAGRRDGCTEAQLQDVVREDARLLQVGIQIVQPVVDRPRRDHLDDLGYWVKHCLISLRRYGDSSARWDR